jgi:hypothetical protein
MALIVLLVLVPPLIIVGANEALDDKKPAVLYIQDSSLGTNVYIGDCAANISSLVIPLIAYFVLLFGLCAFLAYRCRKAPQGFNEASNLLVACSFIFLYGALIMPLQFLGLSPTSLIVLRSFGILLGDIVFLSCICGPKLLIIYQSKHNSKDLVSYKTVVELGNPLREKINQLEEENAGLKKSAEKMSREMSLMSQQISSFNQLISTSSSKSIPSNKSNRMLNIFSRSNKLLVPNDIDPDDIEDVPKRPPYSCDVEVPEEKLYIRQRPLYSCDDENDQDDELHSDRNKIATIPILDKISESNVDIAVDHEECINVVII